MKRWDVNALATPHWVRQGDGHIRFHRGRMRLTGGKSFPRVVATDRFVADCTSAFKAILRIAPIISATSCLLIKGTRFRA